MCRAGTCLESNTWFWICTVTLDGNLIQGVAARLDELRNLLNIQIVTADTRGGAEELGNGLKVRIFKLTPGNEQAQKLTLVQQLGKEHTAAIGNGSNDGLMLKEAALGICV
jgi:P-type E1-E2 ATPase